LTLVNGIGTSGDSYIVEEAGGLARTFNADGYLRLLSEPQGSTISFTRSSTDPHVVTQITDPLGRNLSLAYTAGRLTSVTDATGRTWTLGYDATTAYLVSITSPSVTFIDGSGASATRGLVTSFSYSSGSSNPALNGNLTEIHDDSGQLVLANEYDASDRCVVQENALGGQWLLDYASGRTEVHSPDAFLTRYDYDASRFITRTEQFTVSGMGGTALRSGEPTSYVTMRTRDTSCSCWAPATVTGPDGTTWSFTRNGLGQVLSSTVTPGSGVPGLAATWSYTYAAPYAPGYARVLTATDPLGRTRSFGYDTLGNVTTITEPVVTLGQPSTQTSSSSFTYTSAGEVATVTYPSGLISQFTYATTTRHLTGSMLDPAGLALSSTFTRDAAGRLLTVTHPSGATWTRAYDALGHLLSETEPTGGIARTYTYDFRGNVVRLDEENRDSSGTLSSTNPYWTTTHAYNAAGLVTSTSVEKATSSSVTSSLSYDTSGRVVSSTTPAGRVTSVSYDERGLQFRVTAAPGTSIAATQTYDYDLAGRLSRITDAIGGIQTFAADAIGHLVSTTNEVGTTAQADYDTAGNLVQVRVRNASGTLFDRSDFLVDQRGRRYATSRKIVDTSGSVTGSADSSRLLSPSGWVVQATDPTGLTVMRAYDALGRLSTITFPAGEVTTVSYDVDSRPTTVTHSETVPGSQTPFVWKETATYDSLSRCTSAGRADAYGTPMQASSRAYDGRGDVVRTTDPVGNTITYSWDGLRRNTSVVRDLRTSGTGAGSVTGTVTTGTAYDDDGLVTSQTDDNGNVTTYAWDLRGRRTSMVLQGGATWAYTFDLLSRITGWTDPNGTSVSQMLDAHGRLTARSITRATGVLGPTAESYTWDPMDRVVAASDGDSGIARIYDSLGRLLTEAAGANPAPSSPTTTFSYDLAARLTSIGYPDGLSIQRTYDSDGRLDVVKNGTQIIADLDWTGLRVSRRTLGAGSLVSASSFDAIGRLTGLTWTQQPGNTTLRGFTYSWDAANRLRYEARSDLSGQGDVYRYDSLSRVVDSRSAVPSPAAEVSNPGSQSWSKNFSYSLDGAMNRTSDTRTTWPSTLTTTAYSHDVRNRYTSVGSTTRTYSANGELLSDGTYTYAYDYRGRLVEVRNAGTSVLVASYGWDPLDRRDTRSVAGGVNERRYYAWRALLAIHETTGGGFRRANLVASAKLDRPTAAYVRDEGDLNGNGNTTESVLVLLAQNYSGSLIAATDSSGSLLESYAYDDFGAVSVWAPSGAARTSSLLNVPQRFQAMAYDEEISSYCAGVRSYSPVVGRWFQPEAAGPWADAQELGSGMGALQHAAPCFRDRLGRADERIEDSGEGLPSSLDGTSIADVSKHIAIGAVNENHVAAINAQIARLKEKSKCITLIVRRRAARADFVKAFGVCDTIIAAGHGTAVAPFVEFASANTVNANPPAAGVTKALKVAACGLRKGTAPTGGALAKWVRTNNPDTKVSAPDASNYDDDGCILQSAMMTYIAEQLANEKDNIKDGKCCETKTVCLILGPAHDGEKR